MTDERKGDIEGRSLHRTLDMESLKGLAHPLRVRILDVLTTYGPQTASSLADRLGESSGATSYHLRQLERHRFIHEVEGRGSGRERWWDRVPGGIALEVAQLPPTAAARAASGIVLGEWNRHRQTLLDEFVRRGDDELSPEWIEATATNTANAQVTVEQLAELTTELQEIIDRFVDRYRDQKEHPVPRSRPVQIQLNAFPVMDADEEPETPEQTGKE